MVGSRVCNNGGDGGRVGGCPNPTASNASTAAPSPCQVWGEVVSARILDIRKDKKSDVGNGVNRNIGDRQSGAHYNCTEGHTVSLSGPRGSLEASNNNGVTRYYFAAVFDRKGISACG